MARLAINSPFWLLPFTHEFFHRAKIQRHLEPGLRPVAFQLLHLMFFEKLLQ